MCRWGQTLHTRIPDFSHFGASRYRDLSAPPPPHARSQMPSHALRNFEELLASVDQLIAIHARIQSGRGRRHRQEAIHRAGVVLTVAAWQAYVEKVALEALDKIEQGIAVDEQGHPTPVWVRASFRFRKPSVKKTVGDLNTPNSQNVWRLFDWSFGFDPRPSWVWVSPRRQWNTTQFSSRTDDWLRIRHSIAHGNILPTTVPWIKNNAGTARLTLSLLQECLRHFRELARRTDKAFIRFLRREYRVRTMGR